MTYAKKRYISYAIITIFTFVLPYITINNNHILLLSFDKMSFHFLGYAFNVNELLIMPFLLMILFIGIFAITSIKGRIWCGWACPQTIFRTIYRDLIEGSLLDLRRIKNKQKEPKNNTITLKLKKYFAYFLWLVLCLIISANFMLYFIASEDFFTYMLNPIDHKVLYTFILLITVFLFYDIIFLKENFCTYICPYAMMQSVLYDKNTVHAIYDFTRGGNIYQNREKSIFNIKELEQNDECTTCEACVKICPANIDIRAGLQIECINCLECVDACTSVMGKLNKTTLVSWESVSTRIDKKESSILRGKNLLYIISIVFAVLLASFTLSKKEPFLISINKTTQLYKVKKELVYNNYLVTLNNRLNKDYSYGVKVSNKNFTVSRFKTPKLQNNQRIKTVLIIKTNKRMYLSDKKDTAIKLNVIFFSLEDPSIEVEKTLSFMYPKNSSFL